MELADVGNLLLKIRKRGVSDIDLPRRNALLAGQSSSAHSLCTAANEGKFFVLGV